MENNISSENQDPVPQSTQPEPSATPPPKKKYTRLLLTLCLVILILVAGGYVLSRILSDPAPPQAAKKDIPLLRIGSVTGPINEFYPNASNTEIAVQVNQQIFEGLVQYQDKTKLVPLLATSWTNPDNSTWEFKLKQGVKFHTGRTMTAKDVKGSLEEVKANDQLGDIYSSIAAVDVVDDYTVRITTDGPDPILLNRLAALYIFDSASDKKNDPVNGTGPYLVKPGTTPTENSVQLTAFDNYHGGHVYTRGLHFSWAGEQAKSASDFKNNKVDIAGDFDGSFFTSSNLGSFKPYKTVIPSVSFIGINTNKPGSPLRNQQFREALQYLIDVKAFNRVQGTEGEIVSQYIPKDLPGYNPSISRPTRDVAKAKSLLAAAGYPNGATLTLTTSLEPPEGIQELQKQFAEGGITIKSQDIEDFDQFLDAATGGQTDLYKLAYGSDVLDGIDFLTYLTQQSGNYNVPELNQLVAQANQTFDPAARLKILQQASEVVAKQQLVIPLSSVVHNYAMKRDYNLPQDNLRISLGVYFWKVYAE